VLRVCSRRPSQSGRTLPDLSAVNPRCYQNIQVLNQQLICWR